MSTQLPKSAVAQVDCSLRERYAWADKLAVYYANLYRSSFVVMYFLGVIAIAFELSVDLFPPLDAQAGARLMFRAVAFLALLLILIIWIFGVRRRWHERWIDYRLLAELLRQLRFLSLLGRAPAFSQLPAHNAYGNPRNSWLTWYLRAVAREAGVVDASFTPSYLEATRVLLRDCLVKEQARYHQRNAYRHAVMEERLRAAGMAIFGCALVALGVMILRTAAWVSLIAAIAPVLGGALAAIRSQGELERIVKRSRAMTRQLDSEAEELAQQGPILSSAELAQVADAAAGSMIAEVLDWRIVFQDRPLELAG